MRRKKNKYRNEWKSKVGAEWVTKGQNVDQATNAVSAIGRCAEEKWNHKSFFHPEHSLKNSSAILWIVAMKLSSTSQRSGFLSLVGDHFLTKGLFNMIIVTLSCSIYGRNIYVCLFLLNEHF